MGTVQWRRFVHHEHFPITHQHFTVNDDRVHVARPCEVDEPRWHRHEAVMSARIRSAFLPASKLPIQSARPQATALSYYAGSGVADRDALLPCPEHPDREVGGSYAGSGVTDPGGQMSGNAPPVFQPRRSFPGSRQPLGVRDTAGS